MLPPLLLLCYFFTATAAAAAALLFLRRRAVATGSSSSLLRLLLLLLHRCCCWFTMTVIDINLYYGGLLSNANANKGLPFEGPGIKCYYTQIDHRLKTLNDLKMIVMKELCVNPALHDIQIIFRSPHEVLKHQINYQYMAIEADKHVKIMFDKIERIAQVSAIELYIKLELRAEVGVEEIQQTTTSLQVTVPDAQYESLTHVKDDDDDEDYVDDTTINGEDFVDRDEYEERIDRDDFEIDIDNHKIATNVHADDIFVCGETDANNAISVQNIMNTIHAYTLPALSFSANTRANMERRTIVQIPSMASLNNEEASPSSSTRQWNYDVFLSFRGEDTRKGFTSHLYKALCHKGIYTFIDDKLPRGEEISEELIQAIKNSSILVIVFSENYAESKWCLDELAEIVKCRENDQEVKIRPVFYNVDPSEIRNQKGNFGIALANHEKKFENNKDKVQRWRDALRKAANASGWHYKKGGATYESHFIQKIVNEISDAKLNQTPLYVAEYPVGINSSVEAIKSLLDIGLDIVCIVGIYGLPGVGKTTIAKAVYNKIAKHFDGSSFLVNVRENLGTDAGIITLQEQLLNDILRDGNWKVGNIFRGISLIEERLCCKKVFLILDDVDGSTRLDNLLGKCDWFALGSRVIITLRDRSLLAALKEKVCTTYKVEEFKVEQLNKHKALRLFKAHAFHGNIPCDEDYSKLATKFTDFANGLPLALEIIARDLCGKAKNEWESVLDMYNKIPNKDIQKILRVSYDGLTDTEKYIFLDIACFFKGRGRNYVVKILNACELYPDNGILRLVDKCLITVDRYGILSMHDLIQQMGKEVVRQQAPDILEKRSRLCCYKDSLEVLIGNKGSKKIRGIMLHSPQPVKVQLHAEAFKKMENLKFLIVENIHICEPLEFLPHSLIFLKWPNYPFNLPSEYIPKKLVAIEMPHSHIRLPKLIKQELWLENLIDVKLSHCEFITKLPKLRAPNLENLDLSFCKNLVEFHKLRAPNLKDLDLYSCKNLVKFPKLRAPNLENLHLSYCKNLVEFPKLWAPNLENLNLYSCKNLVEFPKLWAPNLENLNLPFCQNLVEFSKLRTPNLKNLDFYCKNLVEFPKLWAPNLENLKLFFCKNLVEFPKLWAPNLKNLDIRCCENLVEIDECFGSLEKLETWNLIGCGKLHILPSQLRLKSLRSFNLSGCSRLEKLPNFHPEMECLETLELKGTGIREVPSSIEHHTGLRELSLYNGERLRGFPDILYKLRRLQELSIPTAKLRPTSGYGFVNMKELCFRGYKSIIELDLLMKPDYFPALESIDLSYTNIVTIPQSISRLEKLSITNCKLLREIQGLSQSISQVFAENCMLLDIQSPSGLLNQVVEMIWILSNRVCGRARSHKVMDPQLTNYFASETEGAESEDGDISMDTQFFNRTILVDGTEVAKWFNHQSVDNSIFFFVGRKSPKFAVCIVPAQEGFSCSVYISINGKRPNYFPPILGSVQRQLNESNPTDQNLVEISLCVNCAGTSQMGALRQWGHVKECTCPPQESANLTGMVAVEVTEGYEL